jgi:hypothetical protein
MQNIPWWYTTSVVYKMLYSNILFRTVYLFFQKLKALIPSFIKYQKVVIFSYDFFIIFIHLFQHSYFEKTLIRMNSKES